jgi:hypothetical protein
MPVYRGAFLNSALRGLDSGLARMAWHEWPGTNGLARMAWHEWPGTKPEREIGEAWDDAGGSGVG